MNINRYSNQNHAVHRSAKGLDKAASIYDKQGLSNRAGEERSLTFSSLAPYESEAILSVLKKDAAAIDEMGIAKSAFLKTSPFETFKVTKNYIASKLGLGDDAAHDMTSSVVARAQDLHSDVGGELEPIITGIVDSIDVNEIEKRIGAAPMKNSSKQKTEEHIKLRLMQEMQLSAFQADQITKSVMDQARNLSVRMRQASTSEIANAVVDVMVNYQDTSIVYNISSTTHLSQEVEHMLNGD